MDEGIHCFYWSTEVRIWPKTYSFKTQSWKKGTFGVLQGKTVIFPDLTLFYQGQHHILKIQKMRVGSLVVLDSK